MQRSLAKYERNPVHSFFDLVHSFLERCWPVSQDTPLFRKLLAFFASYSVIIFNGPALGWYERAVTHTYDNVKYDSDKHWYECDCGEKKADSEASHTGCKGQQLDKSSHKDLDNDAKCDTCGATVPVVTVGETDKDVDSDGLSDGAIVGIAVGSAAVVGIGGFLLIWFVIKKKSWTDFIAIFKK